MKIVQKAGPDSWQLKGKINEMQLRQMHCQTVGWRGVVTLSPRGERVHCDLTLVRLYCNAYKYIIITIVVIVIDVKGGRVCVCGYVAACTHAHPGRHAPHTADFSKP